MFYCTISNHKGRWKQRSCNQLKGCFVHPVWRFVFAHQTIRTHRRAGGGAETGGETVHAHDAPEGSPSTVFTHFPVKRFLPDSCEGVSCCCWAALFSPAFWKLTCRLKQLLSSPAHLGLTSEHASPLPHPTPAHPPTPPGIPSLSTSSPFHLQTSFSTQFLPSATSWLSAALCLARPVLFRSGIFFFVLKPLKMAEFCEGGDSL